MDFLSFSLPFIPRAMFPRLSVSPLYTLYLFLSDQILKSEYHAHFSEDLYSMCEVSQWIRGTCRVHSLLMEMSRYVSASLLWQLHYRISPPFTSQYGLRLIGQWMLLRHIQLLTLFFFKHLTSLLLEIIWNCSLLNSITFCIKLLTKKKKYHSVCGFDN